MNITAIKIFDKFEVVRNKYDALLLSRKILQKYDTLKMDKNIIEDLYYWLVIFENTKPTKQKMLKNIIIYYTDISLSDTLGDGVIGV